jgi:predicted alpha/beta-hydrolase family hydrolase
MPDTKLTITLTDARTRITAVRTPVPNAKWTLIYAPGASGNLNDPFGRHLASTLPAHGITVVRFQFPYMEAGRKSPDRPAVLEDTWRAVIEECGAATARSESPKETGRGSAASARNNRTKLCVAGRSMGGRIASIVLAGGTPADALALFAYPLHPPGKPDAARIEHLPRIKAPALFVSGTRDAFASPDELKAAAKLVRRATVQLLEAADHGFAVPKTSGRTRTDVYDEAVSALIDFLAAQR